MNIWIGEKWPDSTKRILILGESWFGPEESVHRYVRRWCQGSQPDHFSTSIFNACSGYGASATSQQKFDFWNELAFMNFVYWSVGSTNNNKATAAHYKSAQPDLDLFLRALKPKSLWILGTTHAKYSGPIVNGSGINNIITKHPRSGVPATTLRTDFRRL
jgi:hypothetical protein